MKFSCRQKTDRLISRHGQKSAATKRMQTRCPISLAVILITNKLTFDPPTRLPQLTQNVIRSSHGHSTPSLKISCKSVQPFSRNVADNETKKERKRKKSPENNTPSPYQGRGNKTAASALPRRKWWQLPAIVLGLNSRIRVKLSLIRSKQQLPIFELDMSQSTSRYQYRLFQKADMWRACCYFIILSVIFPDGNRSLLAFLSDLLAR